MLTASISEAIVDGIAAGVTFIVICWVIGIATLIGIVALITWVVKKIWFWGSNKENNQYARSENKTYRNNETEVQRNWREHYERLESEPKWYPTGWTFNEKTKLWEPPDYLSEETEQTWEWDDSKQIWIDREKTRRTERYKEFRKGKEPTFEEWKAAREAERQSDTESTK